MKKRQIGTNKDRCDVERSKRSGGVVHCFNKIGECISGTDDEGGLETRRRSRPPSRVLVLSFSLKERT